MDLFEAMLKAEEDPSIHSVRLLIILLKFGGKNNKKIAGLTKLVKLDFFLRYPLYFSKALEKQGGSPSDLKIKDFEKRSVESRMIRYHYGPWDHRYRRFINNLVAKGLVDVQVEKKTILIGLTEKGVSVANGFHQYFIFQDYFERSELLKDYFDIGAMTLKNFIYETFPEIVSMQKGEVI
jgi:hypothetical protein